MSSLKGLVVRERLLQQAWTVLGLNPLHAKAEKLRWFQQPAARNTLQKPVTYPAIYKEDVHIIPEFIVDMITGKWSQKCTRKLLPEIQHYLDWKREYLARPKKTPEHENQDDDAAISKSSRSTTAGPSS